MEIGKDADCNCKSLSDLKFGGTKAEWKSIKKGQGWHRNIPAKSGCRKMPGIVINFADERE